MRISHSMELSAGMNAYTDNVRGMGKTLEKLSTGLRVNRASDDAAGLSISENLRSQVRGSAQARRNTADGINMLNITDGGLNEIASILQRGRELSLTASTESLADAERKYLDLEMQNLIEEVDRISGVTLFNKQGLLNHSSSSEPLTLQIGANDGAEDRIKLDYGAVNSDSIGIKGVSISSAKGAQGAITIFDDAIQGVNEVRSSVGTITARLERTVNNLMTSETSLQSAESQIRDTDMALFISDFTRQQILTDSSTSMIAQANTQRRQVTRLFD